MQSSIVQPQVRQPADESPNPRFAEDEAGFLYECGFREMLIAKGLDRDQVDAAEALRAVVLAGKVVTQSFEANLAAEGLTHPQFRTLMALRYGAKDGLQMHRIALWLGVTPRNVTGIVDALETQGLVSRVADPTDRRAFKVRMTAAGEARAVAALKINKSDQKRVLGALSKEETNLLRHLCMKLIRAVEVPTAAKEVR